MGCWLALPVIADDTIIGYVKTTTPKAYLLEHQQEQQAAIGSPIHIGTVIKTDAQGTLGLALKDDTLLSFGPDTEFEMLSYDYQPEAEHLKLDMSLIKGSLQYISGVIAKLKPAAVSLKTPSGIIGVRGTRFVVKVED